MHYKTILLELIRENRPLHLSLKRSGTLAATLEQSALELKGLHEALKEDLERAWPGIELAQASAEALEMALKEMEAHFAWANPEDEADSLSLDDAMHFLRRATPRG
jgi:hypothetical protein